MRRENSLLETLRPVGVVFGDIGTSPIYALAITFSFIDMTPENIGGVLSLIFWSLVIVPSLHYCYLAMKLSVKGEGGQIVLSQILLSKIKNKRFTIPFVFLTFIAVSFFIGDSVITPSISILSAYEGLHLVYDISQDKIVLLASVTALLLFLIQKGGAGRVSSLFSPVMVIWFSFLFILGIFYISKLPSVLLYINPYYAVDFFLRDPAHAILALSGVILCVTGSEALYADIGHLGKTPIIKSWFFFVFPALVINYFGQGAFLLLYGGENPFFQHIKNISEVIYIPSVILTTAATIIASQAVISGLLSVVYQGINVGFFPRLKVEHKSEKLQGQIYIGSVNWMAFLFVLFIINFFRTSEKIGHAYGFAVNVVMLISSIYILVIYSYGGKFGFSLLAIFIIFVEALFLISTSHKIEEGGYISVAIALLPLSVLVIFRMGQQKVYSRLRSVPFSKFFEEYKSIYERSTKIPGCAVFLVRDSKNIPPYVLTIIKDMGILYEQNILFTLNHEIEPYGVEYSIIDQGYNLKILKVDIGYMEIPNIRKVFEKFSIKPRVIFYGIEDIITKNPVMKAYSMLKKISPTFESFYDFPVENIHGVITKIEV